VKIGRQEQRSTAISSSNADTILVRGRDLAGDLMGTISFSDHFWLLVTGAMPPAGQRRVLDATLVAIAEHGLVPSVVASRMTLAAAPEALQGAVAAGILGCGSVVLGSSEAAGRFYAEIGTAADRDGLDSAVRAVVGQYRAAHKAIPGYGHPLHKGYDPRARRLFEVAGEAGCAGRHVEIAQAVVGGGQLGDLGLEVGDDATALDAQALAGWQHADLALDRPHSGRAGGAGQTCRAGSGGGLSFAGRLRRFSRRRDPALRPDRERNRAARGLSSP
jgi:hypothetical protein